MSTKITIGGGKTMRKQIFITAILVCNLFAAVAFADDSGCTVANVAGTYGYVGFGTVRAGNPLGLPAGSYSSTGTLTFDGNGNLLIVDTARIDDFFLPPDSTYSATYTVDQHCIATFTIPAFVTAGIPGPHFKAVFVDHRKKILAISLLPGANVNFVNTTKVSNSD